VRILVCGAGFTNKGAEAMLRTVVSQLGCRIPDAEFLIWRCRRGERELAADMGLTPLTPPAISGRGSKLLWTLGQAAAHHEVRAVGLADRNALWRAAETQWMVREAAGFDAVVDISGFAYADSWGYGPTANALALARHCREHSLPVVFMPQAWGGFERPDVRAGVVELLGGRGTLYFSRDGSSSRYLEDALTLNPGSVPHRSDIAFAFDGGTPERGAELLRARGCSLTRPIVGIGPNMRVYERMAGEGHSSVYVQALAKLVQHCVDHHDVDVVLHPSECDPAGAATDDRFVCNLVAEAAAREGRCFSSQDYLTAPDARAVVGQLAFLAGSRFHSLVFALSQGIPCMAIGWSHKYRELLQPFGLAEQAGAHESLDAAQVIEMFEAGWNERSSRRGEILEVAERMRDDALGLFDEVAAFLLGGASEGV
jgi:polysaccharide pyruvyl transferase WcaK-like protein